MIKEKTKKQNDLPDANDTLASLAIKFTSASDDAAEHHQARTANSISSRSILASNTSSEHQFNDHKIYRTDHSNNRYHNNTYNSI
ncbi:hypothetical protein M0804_008110 [Polistes exclamans]|nr:hypothetical protein M0804_008110 [Polistes exclamans]